MNITCPHCGLAGKISDEKLKASSGSVRCPRCRKTFAPAGDTAPGIGDILADTTGAAPNKPTAGKNSVLFGARSGDDIPFTKIMEEGGPVSEADITIEIDASAAADIPDLIDSEEVISLGEEDIVANGDAEMGPGPLADGGMAEMPLGVETVPLTPEDTLGLIDVGPDEEAPAGEPETGRPDLSGRGKKAPAQADSPAPAARKTGARTGFIIFFVIVLALWGGYRFFSTYWPPYAQEKAFLSDSRALFDKYHELRVYLKVGLPDPVFATKVAEAAYVWEVYQEKYGPAYRKDPLYASLMIMGRLFLTIKELLDRDMYPDNYLGLEWGEGFPFVTKEEYVGAMVGGIPICIRATEDNFVFSKKVLDSEGGLNFVSMTASDILKTPTGPSRADYAADLKRANKAFLSLDTEMPVLEEAIVDVRDIMGKLPGK
jgi:predicted Zn finger-like uncharacterized protein